ncbi:MAG: heme-dependent peroxidase [Verrucomicrobiales bacterium]|nr:heme-dependent peroxidase [Verrucomicrobiales bacterium]
MNGERPPHSHSAPQQQPDADHLIPREGWHVIHLFYQVERSHWDLLDEEEKLEAKTNLTRLVQEIRSTESTQLLTFSMVTPKADIGFMLLTPDLHKANEFEKRLTQSLGADILAPVYSYLSLTELSEYVTTDEMFAQQLKEEHGLADDSPEYAERLAEFSARMKKYNKDKLYPNMPDWPVFCFYNMSKRRQEKNNWYSLDMATRRKLMQGHATVGRRWAGKVRQLITGSTGLDEAEWGVTLFSHTSQDIKEIVYEMRFDEVSALYAEFGDFYIGIQLALDELFRRIGL